MVLQTADDHSIELRILGYQFPDLETEEYDSNWLHVEGIVAHPKGNWRFRDPCLLTYEASRLADWLDLLGRGTATAEEIGFIEPNISFRSVKLPRGVVLRVNFELEARPPWAPSDFVGDQPFWMDFHILGPELGSAAASLRDQLKEYPQRAVR